MAAEIEPRLPSGIPILAFSGGADSTALLHGLLRIRELRHLVVAHVDHGLDPASRDRARAAERIARAAAETAGRRFFADAAVEPEPSRHELFRDALSHGPAMSDATLSFIHRSVQITEADRREHGGVEAAARALRYRALEFLCLEGLDRQSNERPGTGRQGPRRSADRTPAENTLFLITAHHLDDQLETLVLRLRQGTGLIGLAGIRPERTTARGIRLHRPLLAIEDPPGGADLRHLLRDAGVSWTQDPSNLDLSIQRNLVRRRLLPALLQAEPEPPHVHDAAHRLARASQRFAAWRDRWARSKLGLRDNENGVALDFERWHGLPRTLRDQALGVMHRAAGLRSDPPAAARAELNRQLQASGVPPSDTGGSEELLCELPEGGADAAMSMSFRQPSELPERCTVRTPSSVACAAGSGWQWTIQPGDSPGSGARLQLHPEPRRSDAPTLGNAADFTYTPRIPGVTEMPEIGCSLQVTREPYDGWMSRAWPDRAACHLPDPRATVTVRNRTTGDTLHPFGSPSKRVKLKKLLIDRKIPRDQRSKLPLVCIGGEIAWVPGVTIGDSFRIPARLTGETPAHRADHGERRDRSGRHRSSGPQRPSDRECPSNDLVWVFRLLPTHTAPDPPRDPREAI